MAQRIEYIDMAKGVGMLSIIIGHNAIPPILFDWIFSFHVPLFFIISGYFCSYRPFNELCLKIWKQLLRPMLVTTFVANIGLALIFLKNGEWCGPNISEWIVDNLLFKGNVTIVGMWFIWALIWGKLFINMLSKSNIFITILIVSLLFMLGYFVYHEYKSYDVWYVERALQVPLYLFVGMLLRKYSVLDKLSNYYIFALSVFILSVAWLSPINSVFYYYKYGVFSVISAIIISVAVLSVLKLLSEKMNCRMNLLQFVGRNSLLILCMHGTLHTWQIQKFFTMLPICMFALIEIVVLLFLAYFLLKLPIVNKLYHSK